MRKTKMFHPEQRWAVGLLRRRHRAPDRLGAVVTVSILTTATLLQVSFHVNGLPAALDYAALRPWHLTLGRYIGSVGASIFIGLTNGLLSLVARALTDFEVHRTETEYEDAYIVKVCIFQFVNSFITLYYIAFVKAAGVDLDLPWFGWMRARIDEARRAWESHHHHQHLHPTALATAATNTAAFAADLPIERRPLPFTNTTAFGAPYASEYCHDLDHFEYTDADIRAHNDGVNPFCMPELTKLLVSFVIVSQVLGMLTDFLLPWASARAKTMFEDWWLRHMVDDDDETAGSAVEVALASPAAATGAEGGARGSSRGGTTGGGEALGTTGERKPRSSSGGGSTSSWRWSGIGVRNSEGEGQAWHRLRDESPFAHYEPSPTAVAGGGGAVVVQGVPPDDLPRRGDGGCCALLLLGGRLARALLLPCCGGHAYVKGMTVYEEQAKLTKFDHTTGLTGVIPQYIRLVIQAGYIVLFAPAFPLAALVCLLSNLIRLRANLSLLLYTTQRAKFRCGQDIGTLQGALRVLSMLAVASHAGLLVFTSTQLQRCCAAAAVWVHGH